MNKETSWISRASSFFSGASLYQASSKLRSIIMASTFGSTSSMGVLALLMNAVSTVRRFFGKGLINYAFLPYYETLKEKDPKNAAVFYKNLIGTIFTILASFVCLYVVLASLILTHLNLNPTLILYIKLSMFLMPSVLFIALFGLNSALLISEKQVMFSAASPIAFNAIWIACLLYIKHHSISDEAAFTFLRYAVVIATFFQWFVTAPRVYALFKDIKNESLFGQFNFSIDHIKKISTPFFYGGLALGAAQINSLIDGIMVGFNNAAITWYATKVYQIPLDIFAVGISSIILPPLCSAIQKNNHKQVQNVIETAVVKIYRIILPLTLLFVSSGCLFVNAFYGRGKFTGITVIETTKALAGYSLGLLPHAIVLILVSALFAFNQYRFAALSSSFSLFINLILSYTLYHIYDYGVFGVAISTSFSGLLNASILGYYLSQQFPVTILTPTVRRIMYRISIIASLSTLITVYYTSVVFEIPGIIQLFGQITQPLTRSTEHQIWQLMSCCICFFGSFYCIDKLWDVVTLKKINSAKYI